MENCYLEKYYKTCHAIGSMENMHLDFLEQNKVFPLVVLPLWCWVVKVMSGCLTLSSWQTVYNNHDNSNEIKHIIYLNSSLYALKWHWTVFSVVPQYDAFEYGHATNPRIRQLRILEKAGSDFEDLTAQWQHQISGLPVSQLASWVERRGRHMSLQF